MRTLYIFLTLASLILSFLPNVYASTDSTDDETDSTDDETDSTDDDKGPTIFKDPALDVELIFTGLERPTNMAFLGPDDILVLEKKEGTVQRIVNGKMLDEPLLDVNVANQAERGMLGIAVAKESSKIYVFLYLTESSDQKDGSDRCERRNYCESGQPIGHRLYKYELRDNKLIDPQLLLDIPSNPGADHVGGVVVIGPDKNIYLITGDGDSCQRGCEDGIEDSVTYAQTSNVKEGDLPKGRGGIIIVTQDGQPVRNGILGDEHPLNLYYAYGIRNSFGIDFDPLTGKLWDTENGPGFGDEINLVEPGFNSGWNKAQAVWPVTTYELLDPTPKVLGYFETQPKEISDSEEPDDLVDFDGRGKYSNPELAWNLTIGVTAIKFYNSDRLGKQYENDMFVGDNNNGNLYHFDLNGNRTELDLKGPLADKVVNTSEELNELIFANRFPTIVDIEVSPDGFPYILSYDGSIYKIIKKS